MNKNETTGKKVGRIIGVWMAIPVAEFVCLFVSVYMFHKNKIRI